MRSDIDMNGRVMTNARHIYDLRPAKDNRGVDLICDAAVANAIRANAADTNVRMR